jgi:hypothetical protein
MKPKEEIVKPKEIPENTVLIPFQMDKKYFVGDLVKIENDETKQDLINKKIIK